MTKHDRQTLAIMARAAFRTLTVIALPAAILTTLAWFTSAHVVFSQLSPFRVQYAVLLAAHAVFCLLLRRARWGAVFAAFSLFNIGAVLHATRLLSPAPSSRHASAIAAVSDVSLAPLKIVYANVLSSNADSAPLLAFIAAEKPDLVALLEVNGRWQTQLVAALSADYPFHDVRPREDNFGLALFSRSQPAGGRIEFFADVETPSFDFTSLRPQGPIRILLTHPLPPGDATANLLRNQHLDDLRNWCRFVEDFTSPGAASTPVIILGDFNATPWCPPLRRLLSATGLRAASGDHGLLASSWPVPIPFLRVPLDHALLSSELACVSYRLGPDIGSDHFPFVLEVRAAR